MSGRIYDNRKGVPICPECGNFAYRSDETNWNGTWCEHCAKGVFCEKFDETHPAWVGYEKHLKDWIDPNEIHMLPFNFKTYKKKNGITY